ncbi:hypothetical protein OE88DRAFT_1723942 [Heliocybe sulcata]|uniref:Uncharacterized protein n=1 Tax=Heliocybe sulcata TaxID=5364 RepID=A0A5C3NA71_9AGAM|nr:hypothetical protein OE88DRAFT_1723942 [Heliocybe sulcata]
MHGSPAITQTIQEYIDNRRDLSDLISTLAEPIEKAYTEGRIDTPDSAEEQLWSLWLSVLDVAKRAPHTNSDAQMKLVDLMAAFKARPNPPAPSPVPDDWVWRGGNLWTNLAILGPSVREDWNSPPSTSNAGTSPEEWTNVNAFIARLTNACIADFLLYAIWSVRPVLEEDEVSTAELDMLVPAAAVWFLYLGERIHESDEEYGGPGRGGTVWTGKKGFCKERWQLWKERMAIISQNTGISVDTRDIANEALKTMDTIDGTTK